MNNHNKSKPHIEYPTKPITYGEFFSKIIYISLDILTIPL